MAVSSLPSPYGTGTLGKAAYDFVDFLKAAGQSYWQMLPLNPTSYGDSPYQSFSAYAGNPYFIDPDMLVKDGLLKRSECTKCDWGGDPRHVDYGKIYESRFALLHKAYKRGWERDADKVAAFVEDNSRWLPDYALYMACKRHFGMKAWTEWEDEDIRLRKSEAVLEKYRALLADDVQFFTYLQFLFFSQWELLRDYVHQQGIRIIGDLPIYVSLDSADVWAEPQFFQLDEELVPKSVAGVPPDYFTADGQLWGNPLYDWDYHRRTGYAWWIRRIRHALFIYDILRIDHFRGFDTYWAIPAGESTARNGRWENGPGMDLFRTLHNALGELPIVAEDLGEMFDSVRQLLADSGFPGMKVLQFAFTGEDSVDLPHNYPRNCVAYPGTHDNNTLAGWFGEELPPEYRQQAREYFALNKAEGELRGMLRGVMASTAALAIIPMADWLEEPSASRMNTPGVAQGNWQWRVDEKKLTPALAREIKAMTVRYFRAPATRK